MLINIKL